MLLVQSVRAARDVLQNNNKYFDKVTLISQLYKKSKCLYLIHKQFVDILKLSKYTIEERLQ